MEHKSRKKYNLRPITRLPKRFFISNRLKRDLEKEVQKFRLLYNFAIAMSGDRSFADNLKIAVEKTQRFFQSDTSFIALHEEKEGIVYMHTVSGIFSDRVKEMRLPVGAGAGGLIIESNKGYIFDDYLSDPNIKHIFDGPVKKEGLVSGMAVPINSGSRVLGVFYIFNRYKTSFNNEDLQLLILVANLVAVEISRHQVELDLKESQQRLTNIIEFLPDPTLVINLNGEVITWNRAIEEMTGLSKEEMLGRGNYEYAIPFYGKRQPILIDMVVESQESIDKHYLVIQKDEEALIAETALPCVSGKPLVLWGKATPLYDSQGKLVGAIESIRDISNRKKAEEELQEKNKTLEELLEGTVNALAITAEKRDPYTAGHQRRVAEIAVKIAAACGLDNEKQRDLFLAALLHDIGKIQIPADILTRPGKLSEIEFMMVKTHAEASYDIVKSIPFKGAVSQIILQHHERIDGSGYPYGLENSDILLEARILAIADVAEAMASHRPYRPALGINKALNELQQKRGILYDANMVDIFGELLKKGELNLLFQA